MDLHKNKTTEFCTKLLNTTEFIQIRIRKLNSKNILRKASPLVCLLKTFHASGLFLYTLKATKNLWFCFQGVKRETSGMKWVNQHHNKKNLTHFTAALSENVPRVSKNMIFVFLHALLSCLHTFSSDIKRAHPQNI